MQMFAQLGVEILVEGFRRLGAWAPPPFPFTSSSAGLDAQLGILRAASGFEVGASTRVSGLSDSGGLQELRGFEWLLGCWGFGLTCNVQRGTTASGTL